MRGRKSIFDLERRSDILADYLRLIEDIKKVIICSRAKKNCTLYDFLNESIQDWPFRQAAYSINLYLHNLDIKKAGDDFVDTIYALELLINLLEWAPIHNSKLYSPLGDFWVEFDVRPVCKRYVENIEFILEQNNMAVREFGKDEDVQYRIYKRNAEVDAALETAPEMAEMLLSYLDIRNEKDEKFKKGVLIAIADYLEPKRKQFKGTIYSGLCDDVFFVFNNCNIRHNTDKQVKMKKADRMKMYDSTFKMCLLLIQSQEVDKYIEKIQELKKVGVN